MFLIIIRKLKIVSSGCAVTALLFAPTFSVAGQVSTPQMQEEMQVITAKREFLTENKQQAEYEWIQQQNEAAKAMALAENMKIAENEARIIEAENEKQEVKKTAIKKAAKKLKSAQKNAQATAKKLEKLAKQSKKETSQKKQEDLGNETIYNIGEAGRSEWKSFEYHTKEDDRPAFSLSSDQYKLSQKAYTGKYGIRTVDGRYCVAVGSKFGERVGTKLDVVFESGIRIKCIMGDQKSDNDTDDTHSYHLSDGSYLEFIVDRNAISQKVKLSGNLGIIDEFSGKIIQIIVYR